VLLPEENVQHLETVEKMRSVKLVYTNANVKSTMEEMLKLDANEQNVSITMILVQDWQTTVKMLPMKLTWRNIVPRHAHFVEVKSLRKNAQHQVTVQRTLTVTEKRTHVNVTRIMEVMEGRNAKEQFVKTRPIVELWPVSAKTPPTRLIWKLTAQEHVNSATKHSDRITYYKSSKKRIN